jgi:signal transduction histidine kinase
VAEGKLIGVINLGQDKPFTFTEDYIKSAHQIAMQLALLLRNAQLFEQIHAARVRLQQLTKRLVSAQEEERRRISFELHDDVGQVMTALKIKQTIIQKKLQEEGHELYPQLEEAIELTSDSMDRIRSLAHDLRPPALDAVGLNQAVKDLCQRITHQVALDIDYLGMDFKNLPSHYGISLYRVIQEALNNTIKHAHATDATIRLSMRGDTIVLKMTDSGIGFDPKKLMSKDQPTGLGLQSISERIEALGGSVEISSHLGQGTTLLVQVPWRQIE